MARCASSRRRLHLSRPGRRPSSLCRPARTRPVYPAWHIDGRHHRDDLCDGARPAPLRALVLNDVGPDAEHGSQRITQMVGSRPDAVRDIGRRHGLSPRSFAGRRRTRDRRPARTGAWRLAAATGRQMGLEAGPGLYPPARRAGRAGPPRPLAGARAVWPVLPWLCGVPLAMYCRRRRPGAWGKPCRRGELLTIAGVGHAPSLSRGRLARRTRTLPLWRG